MLGDGISVGVEKDHARAIGGKPARRAPASPAQALPHPKHEAQTLARIAGVERKIRTPSLEDAEEPNQHLQGALNAQPNHHLGTNPQGAQVMRQPVRPRIKLAMAEAAHPRTPQRSPAASSQPAPQTAQAASPQAPHAMCRSTPAGADAAPPAPECRSAQSADPGLRWPGGLESSLQIDKLLPAVRCGVAVEIDPNVATVQPVVQGDGEIVDRTIRKVMGGDGMAGEMQIVIEWHEIDGRAERSPIAASPDVSPQICDVVALMPNDLAHSSRGFASHLGEGHARMHSQPHRQDVGHHCRSPSRHRRHASRQWNTEHDVLRAGEAMHEDCRSRGDELRQGHAGAVCDRVQMADARRRQPTSVPDESGRTPARAIAEARRLRQIGQVVRPKFAILFEPVGRVIFRVIFQ